MDGILHILANTFIVYPVTQKLLTSKKIKSPGGRRLAAILFLCIFGLLSISFELVNILNEPNAFRIMGVSRKATSAEIRKAYKIGVVNLHPDSNPGKEDEFIDFKAAYDKLLNEEFRKTYDKWGDKGSEWLLDAKADVQINGAMQIGLKYCFLTMVTFFVQIMSGSNERGKAYCFIALFSAFTLDISGRFQDVNIVCPGAQWLTANQLLELFSQTYFTFITAIIVFTKFTFREKNDQLIDVAKVLILQQEQMFERLTNLEQTLRLKTGGDKGENVAPQMRNLPRNLRHKAQTIQQQTQKEKGIPRWVFMIALYFFVNYFLK